MLFKYNYLKIIRGDHPMEVRKAKPSAKKTTSQSTPEIFVVASKGDIQKMEQLLKSQDINKVYSGYTALAVSVQLNQIEMVKFLLEHGAKSEGNDTDVIEPLYFAASKGFDAIVALLIKHKAPLDKRNKVNHQTALHVAVMRGHTHVVRLLLPAMTTEQINLTLKIDNNEKTALQLAGFSLAQGNVQLDIIKTFIEHAEMKPASAAIAIAHEFESSQQALLKLSQEHAQHLEKLKQAALTQAGSDKAITKLAESEKTLKQQVGRLKQQLQDKDAEINSLKKQNRISIEALKASMVELSHHKDASEARRQAAEERAALAGEELEKQSFVSSQKLKELEQKIEYLTKENKQQDIQTQTRLGQLIAAEDLTVTLDEKIAYITQKNADLMGINKHLDRQLQSSRHFTMQVQHGFFHKAKLAESISAISKDFDLLLAMRDELVKASLSDQENSLHVLDRNLHAVYQKAYKSNATDLCYAILFEIADVHAKLCELASDKKQDAQNAETSNEHTIAMHGHIKKALTSYAEILAGSVEEVELSLTILEKFSKVVDFAHVSEFYATLTGFSQEQVALAIKDNKTDLLDYNANLLKEKLQHGMPDLMKPRAYDQLATIELARLSSLTDVDQIKQCYQNALGYLLKSIRYFSFARLYCDGAECVMVDGQLGVFALRLKQTKDKLLELSAPTVEGAVAARPINQ